jgi:hypothetical protein
MPQYVKYVSSGNYWSCICADFGAKFYPDKKLWSSLAWIFVLYYALASKFITAHSNGNMLVKIANG